MNLSLEELLLEIKKWYNGYSWNAKDFVYNPFSFLSFLEQKSFKNFWFSTGTPTFLTKLLVRNQQYALNNLIAGSNSFETSNLANLDFTSVLLQTGYLTLKQDEGFGMYSLDFPNLEVQDSFSQYLLAEYTHQYSGQIQSLVFQLYKSLKELKITDFMSILKTLFSSIPSEIFLSRREAYYHSIIFLTLKLLGFFILSEVRHAKGRLDAIVFFPNTIFIFEFKLNKSPAIAIAQIKEKGYANPFLKDGKSIYLIGINLNSDNKDELEYATEQLL